MTDLIEHHNRERKRHRAGKSPTVAAFAVLLIVLVAIVAYFLLSA